MIIIILSNHECVYIDPLCLDDEECMEEEQSNGEIYDKPESPTTTVQESPPPILQEVNLKFVRRIL